MHNETMLKEAKAKAKAQAKAQKNSKDTADKTDLTSSPSKSKQGASSKKSKDKTKVKNEKSGKQSKQSTDAGNKTPSKSTPKSKQSSTDAAATEKTKDQSKKTDRAVTEKQVDDNDSVQVDGLSAKISVPSTLSISETGRGSPVVKLTPMDTESEGTKRLLMQTKLNEDKDLLAADGSKYCTMKIAYMASNVAQGLVFNDYKKNVGQTKVFIIIPIHNNFTQN